MIFRMLDGGPEVVRTILLDLGWEEADSDSEDWQIMWRGGRFKRSVYKSLGPSRRCNHFPKSTSISRKDNLFRHLRQFRTSFGRQFSFFPDTYILPNEYTKFCMKFGDEESLGLESVWILKPSDMSRGRNISLVRNPTELNYDGNYVVQRYVERPLLINGHKSDIRLYVLVTRCCPLQAYVYTKGLVRFSAQEYSMSRSPSAIKNKYAHLTNYSLNKNMHDGEGSSLNLHGVERGKWSLEHMQEYLAKQPGKEGLWESKVWPRIQRLIVLTLMCLPSDPTEAFELFGYDVLLDEDLTPNLLEVNSSPALSCDTEVDAAVKHDLAGDMFAVLGVKSKSMDSRWTDYWSAAEGTAFSPVFPFNEATEKAELKASGQQKHIPMRMLLKELRGSGCPFRGGINRGVSSESTASDAWSSQG